MEARLGFVRHFLSNLSQTSVTRSLRKQLFKIVECHMGGGSEKGQKSVTYYLNGPLEQFFQQLL